MMAPETGPPITPAATRCSPSRRTQVRSTGQALSQRLNEVSTHAGQDSPIREAQSIARRSRRTRQSRKTLARHVENQLGAKLELGAEDRPVLAGLRAERSVAIAEGGGAMRVLMIAMAADPAKGSEAGVPIALLESLFRQDRDIEVTLVVPPQANMLKTWFFCTSCSVLAAAFSGAPPSSRLMNSTARPSMPPLSLTSLKAAAMPLFISTNGKASGPVRAAVWPMRQGSDWARAQAGAPRAATAAVV